MKKLLIFISITIILMTLWFKFISTSPSDHKITNQEITIKTSKDKVVIKNTAVIKTQAYVKKATNNENILNIEIKLLLKQAETLLQKANDEEAIKIYNLIIDKIANSNDPLLLEYFVTACMGKGYIYQIYPNSDDDAAIEAYNMIINKFEKTDNIKFIQYYIDAKIQLSYLLSNDERIEAYNELLNKFEKNMNIDIQKKLESLLISKSFQLMGVDDEEAMQILDKVIEKYQEQDNTKDNTTNIPENIRFSILNNIELALITNNEDETYVELAKKFMSGSSDTKPLLDMLEIIKNSQELNQDDALENWKEEHKDYHFPDWSFQEVERWAYHIEDKETKQRVTKSINAFIDQKYNIPDKISEPEVYNESKQKNNVYTLITQGEMTEEEIYQQDINNSSDEETHSDTYEESESETYEPDPYAQEIYEATGEYPNPYE